MILKNTNSKIGFWYKDYFFWATYIKWGKQFYRSGTFDLKNHERTLFSNVKVIAPDQLCFWEE